MVKNFVMRIKFIGLMFVAVGFATPGCGGGGADTVEAPAKSDIEQYLADHPDEVAKEMAVLDE